MTCASGQSIDMHRNQLYPRRTAQRGWGSKKATVLMRASWVEGTGFKPPLQAIPAPEVGDGKVRSSKVRWNMCVWFVVAIVDGVSLNLRQKIGPPQKGRPKTRLLPHPQIPPCPPSSSITGRRLGSAHLA